MNEIGRHRRQAIIVALRPAVFDCHVLALDIAGFFQPLTKCGQHRPIPVRRRAIEESDHRHRRRLRTRREWRGCRAAEKREEFAPSHWFSRTTKLGSGSS
jgi:hypothetical protein